MKRLLLPFFTLLFVLFSANNGFSQAQAGGIAFVGYNGDGTKGLAFVLLQEAPAGLSIFFNDNEWNGSSFNSGEGTVTWTNSTGSAIAAGTVIILDDLTATETASVGSVTVSGSFNPAGSNDVVYAYLGTVSTPSLFLAAIANDGYDDGTSKGTLSGTGLVAGQTAISFTGDLDVMVLNGPIDCGVISVADCAILINTSGSWTTDNGNGDQSQDGSDAEFPTTNGGGTGVIGSITSPSGGGSLPVEFIHFTAKSHKDQVALTWSTASEENNSHFEIEHSTNGRDFEAIGKVAGEGTSAEKQQYSYMHEKAAPGKNYYRLRQVDFDGAFEYSPVAVVKLTGKDRVQIRPTLADEQVSLVFDEAIRQEARLEVFDVAGRQVSTGLISPGTEQFELSVADFTKGMYFIQLGLNGEISTLKFIKR